MVRKDIENKIYLIFSDVTYVDLEDIDVSSPLWFQHGLDEIDILDVFLSIDEEFGTHLFSNRDINIYTVTIDELFNLIEQELK